MDTTVAKITREELYGKVWATPIVKLAKELGYPYVELVQVCAALRVPRPPVGYWYRLAHGGPQEQVPLPPAEPGVPTEVALGSRTLSQGRAESEAEETPEVSLEMQTKRKEASRDAIARPRQRSRP